MTNLKKIVFILMFVCCQIAQAQKGVTTFGIQYKPIIPNPLIGFYSQDFNVDNFESSVNQKVGHSFGMVVRRGLSNILSFETGLVFTQRNFGLNFALPDSGLSASGDVGFVAYEIPFKGMVLMRLGENVYMNTAGGVSFNYFPSDVSVEFQQGFGEYFLQEGARLNRIQGAVLANIGFEYRTKDKGYFYLGGSFNLPFTSIVTFAMSYENPPAKILAIDNIRGSYLTLDLRYYFHEKAERQ
jgi:hypothetical protein